MKNGQLAQEAQHNMSLSTPIGTGSEDDHKFRSKAVHWLLHHEGVNESSEDKKSIPKIVLQYWHSKHELPSDVAECMESWRKLQEEGFEIVRFDDLAARQFVAANFTPRHCCCF